MKITTCLTLIYPYLFKIEKKHTNIWHVSWFDDNNFSDSPRVWINKTNAIVDTGRRHSITCEFERDLEDSHAGDRSEVNVHWYFQVSQRDEYLYIYIAQGIHILYFHNGQSDYNWIASMILVCYLYRLLSEQLMHDYN